jgi:hypothetical protein
MILRKTEVLGEKKTCHNDTVHHKPRTECPGIEPAPPW